MQVVSLHIWQSSVKASVNKATWEGRCMKFTVVWVKLQSLRFKGQCINEQDLRLYERLYIQSHHSNLWPSSVANLLKFISALQWLPQIRHLRERSPRETEVIRYVINRARWNARYLGSAHFHPDLSFSLRFSRRRDGIALACVIASSRNKSLLRRDLIPGLWRRRRV